MNEARGRFITIEGGEGVGKSTNMAFIQSYLDKNNIEYIHTREPGGTPLAENIRRLFLDITDEQINPTTELLLVFAARSQHLNELIQPQLDKGIWVLCDRFTDATYAYQGGGRGMDDELIGQLELIVQRGVQPDYTILLDAPVEIGMERARDRGELDRLEQQELAFFTRVRNKYLELAEQNSQRYRVIDASKSLEQVQSQLGEVIEAILNDRSEH